MSPQVWTVGTDRFPRRLPAPRNGNPSAAVSFGMELFKSTRHLGSFPQSCRVFQETGDGSVRELLHRGDRIFYQEYGGAIDMHLRHGSRRDPKF